MLELLLISVMLLLLPLTNKINYMSDSVLNANQAKRLNEKMETLSKDLHALLVKHELSDLAVNAIHFRPRGIDGFCISPTTGRPGVWVCDQQTGECACQ